MKHLSAHQVYFSWFKLHASRLAGAVLLAMLLQQGLPAWAESSDKASQDKAAKLSCQAISAEDKTQLEMIGKVLADGKAYAAIAFLDASKLELPQARLYRAHALRQTGQYEQSAQYYQALLGSCVSGLAYQGMGLLAEMQDQHEAAISYLKVASTLLPVESRVRGDYGYALMMAGDNRQALAELLTAIELDGKNRLAINNLILLMFKTGQDEKASQIASDYGITEQNLAEIRDSLGQSSLNPAAKSGQRQQYMLGSCNGNTQLCTGILSPTLELVQ